MAELVYDKTGRLLFTEEMRKEYTLLVPQMLPMHFAMLVRILQTMGYKVEMLNTSGKSILDYGQKYVHNDACYPAILVIGQLIDAIKSGKYDPHKVALVITQTGGGCRASNYIHMLRKALERADLGYVPVISVNLSGLEKNPGFHLTLGFIRKAVYAVFYGDLLMNVSNQVRPYEVTKGDTDRAIHECMDFLLEGMNQGKGLSYKSMVANFDRIIDRFKAIPVAGEEKVRVGVVGEIYVKYSPLGNNGLEEFLATQDCEVNLPGLMGFVQYCAYNPSETARLYGGTFLEKHISDLILGYIGTMEKVIIKALKDNGYHAPLPFNELTKLTDGLISKGDKMGEGWLLTAEMAELIQSGYENIVCAQPFGCLPNHICGKGMINKLRELYPQANITPIDYDPSATRVNQENRIKLMLAVARERLAERTAPEVGPAAEEQVAPADDKPEKKEVAV
jgi:predicted nucleotide-binding protein (sugar kinase/HSP70/actin superfamily)